MRKLTQITTLIAVVALFAAPAFSDTLVLKSGERVSGFFEGGSARVIKFRTNDGVVKDYDLLSVQQIQFNDDKASTTPSSSLSSSSTTSSPSSTRTTTSSSSSSDP